MTVTYRTSRHVHPPYFNPATFRLQIGPRSAPRRTCDRISARCEKDFGTFAALFCTRSALHQPAFFVPR